MQLQFLNRGVFKAILAMAIVLASVACQPAAAPPPPATAPTAAGAPAASAPTAKAPAAPSPTTAPPKPTAAAPKPTAAAPKPTAAPRKIKIATVTPSPVVLPLFYAQEKGLFAKHGLDPDIQIVSATSNPIAALTNGEVQILMISAEGLDAGLEGLDLVYVYTTTSGPLFSLYAKPEYTDVAQLRGKKIGVASANSSSENLLKFALKKAGLSISDVDVMYTGGTAQQSLAALSSGQLDATILSSPGTLTAKQAGFRELVNGPDSGWTYLSNSGLVTKRYAAENRDVVLSYVKVMVEAMAGIQKDRAGAMAVIGKTNNIQDEKTLNTTYDEYTPRYLKVPIPPLAGVQAALADRASSKPAAATADPAKFVDEQFVRELERSGFIQQVYGN